MHDSMNKLNNEIDTLYLIDNVLINLCTAKDIQVYTNRTNQTNQTALKTK